jgi:uncharacterized protein YndB with AHSA1/START domain
VHMGTYQLIDRPRVLEFTWRSHATNQADSVVRVTFEPDGDATVVQIRHERLPDGETARNHSEGWTEILGQLERKMTGMEAA